MTNTKQIKSCSICKQSKEGKYFYKKKSSNDGMESSCKDCSSKKKRKAYLMRSDSKIRKDAERKRKYQETYQESPERKERRKIYDKDRNKKLTKKRQSDPEYLKQWRDKRLSHNINKDSEKVTRRKWKSRNKHIVAWRQILADTIRRVGGKKENKTIHELGYSANDLKKHLEGLFANGMSWENHGEWHIDHKKAVSKFSKGSKMSYVNRLDNLQPLWAFDNLSKGAT